ncbi:hypothetical protein [Nocardiopsis sp. CC223A]|uniref:hypothetical protein n=1 Tax=Nocardiopsis sp. CC223A TaxID=3044051 RepID=UPI0027956472|nr:hypothetical protein [Nocardiopsis sp. CC223A]
MRALSDTDSPSLPHGANDLENPSAHLPAGRPHGAPHERPPAARAGRRNRGLVLACTSAAAAALLLGLLESSSLHRAFGEPDPVGHCLRTDSGHGPPP